MPAGGQEGRRGLAPSGVDGYGSDIVQFHPGEIEEFEIRYLSLDRRSGWTGIDGVCKIAEAASAVSDDLPSFSCCSELVLPSSEPLSEDSASFNMRDRSVLCVFACYLLHRVVDEIGAACLDELLSFFLPLGKLLRSYD